MKKLTKHTLSKSIEIGELLRHKLNRNKFSVQLLVYIFAFHFPAFSFFPLKNQYTFFSWDLSWVCEWGLYDCYICSTSYFSLFCCCMCCLKSFIKREEFVDFLFEYIANFSIHFSLTRYMSAYRMYYKNAGLIFRQLHEFFFVHSFIYILSLDLDHIPLANTADNWKRWWRRIESWMV